MADDVRVGTAGLPGGVPRVRYFERLDFLELEDSFFELPRPSVVARWRAEAGPAARFAVVAWQGITHLPAPGGYPRLRTPLPPDELAGLGALRDTPQVRAAVARCLETVTSLGAEAIVFRTAPSFTPSAANREVLRRFFAEVLPPLEAVTRVWEPQGLWEPSSALALASELGIVLAFDPLARDPVAPDQPLPLPADDEPAYLRVTGLGHSRPNLSADELAELAELAAPYQRAWIVLGHAEKYRDAVRLRKLLQQGGDS